MATTCADLIRETYRFLLSGQQEVDNRLNANVGAADAFIVFKYPLAGIVPHSTIAIGLEEIRVWETDGNQQATVVERGINGSTAATHSQFDYVVARPKFSDFRIFTALNEELGDLASPMNGLFAVNSVEITYNPAVQGYDITGATDVIDILEVRYKVPGPTKRWPDVRNYELDRAANTSDFPSGFMLRIDEAAFPGLPLRVRYSSRYGTFADGTTTLASVGLSTSQGDIPPLGAAIRLVAPRELKRNFTESQSDPRKFEEVPSGSIMKSILALQQLRTVRIQAEADRLASDWPTRLAMYR